MESLLANYGSSDEEGGGREGERQKRSFPPPPPKPLYGSTRPPRPPPPPSSLISSPIAPPPRSSSSSSAADGASSISLFSSLPRPKASSPSSSIFSSLPPPKSTPPSSSSSSSSFFSSLPPPEPSARKVVQFRPPADVSLLRPADIDEDEEESKEKRRKKTLDFSSKPLSSIIPAPKNTLCLAPAAASASLRRSVVETALPAGSNEPPAPEQPMAVAFGDQGSYQGQWVDAQSDSGAAGGDAAAGWPSTAGSYGAHASYGSYEGYESYGNHGGDWGYDPSALETVGATEVLESARALGKRGRNAIPSEILEVKQEELVKNRPREDQVKLTGIAFGPAYQPAASSGKGKPSKLHKRKHQIGSLYHDMRQKEMELAERRSRGLLTKKETQAKYGW